MTGPPIIWRVPFAASARLFALMARGPACQNSAVELARLPYICYLIGRLVVKFDPLKKGRKTNLSKVTVLIKVLCILRIISVVPGCY